MKKKNPPEKQAADNKYFDLLGLTIIILLGIIVYSNSFDCSFHIDDLRTIVDNAKVHNLSDVKAWWNFSSNRPIAIFTLALNYHYNQLDVRYYHLVNLVIHLINSYLVCWLTLLIFSSPVLKDHPIVKHKKVLACLTALLFVSHPLATQSVTYIVQRMTSMAAMFYLLSIALYVKARLSNKGNISQYLLFTGSLISAVLAMLTKENAFTLPFAVVLFEIFFLRTKKLSITGIIPSVPSTRDGIVRLSIPQSGMQVSRINFKDYRLILLMAAFLGVVLIIPLKYSFSVFKTIPPNFEHAYPLTPFTYLFTQFSVIVKYIQLLFLPINQNLYYDFRISNNFFEIRTLVSFLILLSLIILAIFLFKKQRIISFGIFWFFLTLSIESSVIPINDVIHEHRTYLPSFGFFLILSTTLYVLLWNKYKYLAISILVSIIGSNSLLTYERNKIWKDDITLWSDIVSKIPNRADIILTRGVEYGFLGQWEDAIADFSKAIGINPNYRDAYYNRGIAYGVLGQWDKAIADYSKAIEIDPKYTDAYSDRGVAYDNLGQWNKAIADYSKAITIDSGYVKGYYNRGVIYLKFGPWYMAIADFSKAIGIDPQLAAAYNNRGVAYAKLGQWDKAIDDYSKAIEINPNFTQAYSSRAFAYTKLGKGKK